MSTETDISGFIEHRREFESRMKPQWRELARVAALLMREMIAGQFDPSPLAPGTFNTGNRLHINTGSLLDSFMPGDPQNVFTIDISAERVRVSNGSDHPAAGIQQYGGVIRASAAMIRFFWARYIETHLPYWKILALAARIRGKITIKPHPYLDEAGAQMESQGIDRLADEVMESIARTWYAIA